MIQKYKRTWCDYLTPCKIKPDIMVGSYECQEECPYFKSAKEKEGRTFKPGDTARYLYVWSGEVECSATEDVNTK